MNILVTGAKGFVGKNLIANLKADKVHSIFEYDIDSDISDLKDLCDKADFVFHFAGVNRTLNESEFMDGNFGFTSTLLDNLSATGKKTPVLVTSSIQADLDNPYGRSKKAGEQRIFEYGKNSGAEVFVYRLPNVFGKWCRPNYNSAVSTFCNNIALGIPITVNNKDTVLNLVYIDDVVREFIAALNGKAHRENDYCFVPTVYKETLGNITELLYSFKSSRENLSVPNLADGFEKSLYSTFLSYLSADDFGYNLKINKDNRGSFTEIIKTDDRGQFSVNKSAIGITKGNHWHNTKCEKFLVVSGKALLQFRKIGEEKIIEYIVDGENLRIVDIPPGYTHNIKNIGDSELITFMWANEKFNPDNTDTFYEEV